MRNPRRIFLAIAIGLASFVVTMLVTADRLPDLDAAALAVAHRQWRAAAVTNYDLAIETEGTGLGLGSYRVEVQSGAVARFLRDGQPATGGSSAYSVDGLIGLLERELELAADPAASFGAPAGYRVYLKARFDARGVPLQFRRVVGGTNRWAEWRVTELVVR